MQAGSRFRVAEVEAQGREQAKETERDLEAVMARGVERGVDGVGVVGQHRVEAVREIGGRGWQLCHSSWHSGVWWRREGWRWRGRETARLSQEDGARRVGGNQQQSH